MEPYSRSRSYRTIQVQPGWHPAHGGHLITMRLHPGDIVIIVGANGAGKSSLLSEIAQTTAPAAFLAGPGVFAEREVDPVQNALQQMHPQSDPKLIAKELSRLGLDGGHPLRRLSNGERQRCVLVAATLSTAPILLLDAPAAYLDSASLDQLEALVQKATERQRAVVIATSDPEVVLRFGVAALYTLVDGALFTRRSAC